MNINQAIEVLQECVDMNKEDRIKNKYSDEYEEFQKGWCQAIETLIKFSENKINEEKEGIIMENYQTLTEKMEALDKELGIVSIQFASEVNPTEKARLEKEINRIDAEFIVLKHKRDLFVK